MFANRDSGSSSSRFRKDQGERNIEANTNANIGDYNFNMSTSELVTVLRSMGDKVRWPKEMRSNPNRRNLDFWCEFHNDHGHRTSDYRLLQGEVEYLLKQGYLMELFSEKGKQAYIKNRQEPLKPPSPKRTINVINGGEEVNGITYTVARKTTKFTITHGKRTRQTLEDGNITFDDADADGLMIPHNDALVISLLIYDTNVKRVLIDQGETELSTYAEGVIKETKFQVIDTYMAYNVILGRPWIHDMDVVPSTLHQVIKFSSKWGVQQIR
ncbi:uncharacterized protein [Nicotiana tomentosiformis]|uniref:uncharacterized protein n=1 Tax=Nicotiana tomentosiformis TaxID=4098 RepID=UPI00388C64F5